MLCILLSPLCVRFCFLFSFLSLSPWDLFCTTEYCCIVSFTSIFSISSQRCFSVCYCFVPSFVIHCCVLLPVYLSVLAFVLINLLFHCVFVKVLCVN